MNGNANVDVRETCGMILHRASSYDTQPHSFRGDEAAIGDRQAGSTRTVAAPLPSEVIIKGCAIAPLPRRCHCAHLSSASSSHKKGPAHTHSPAIPY